MLLNFHKQQQAFESKNHTVNVSLIRLTPCAETQMSEQLLTQENTVIPQHAHARLKPTHDHCKPVMNTSELAPF